MPRLAGPIPHAGSWGLPGTGTGRPVTMPPGDFGALRRTVIRTGEGTASAVVPASGAVKLSVGPDGLNTWYVTYCAISSTSGAGDASTAQCLVGPIGAGLSPGGQSYAGGGDSIGLGNQRLAPGDYVTIVWSGAKTGDQVTMTVYGSQDILVPAAEPGYLGRSAF